MTLREKILKTFIVTIREINMHGGSEQFFKKYPVGGMYYYGAKRYIDEEGNDIGTSTTLEMLRKCRACSAEKLFICADVADLEGQTVALSQRSLGAIENEDLAYDYGKIIGMQMVENDIDWVLSPSMDLYLHPAMPLLATGDDPERIARIYTKVIKGIQDQGICATAKHFPGMGTSIINMHFAPSNNTLSFEKWMESYGYTYKEVIKAGVQSVMTTHTALKAYDNEFTDGYYPIATFSKKLTTNLLKEELGFSGAVVTDALIMGGMATGDIVKETVQAFKAGADFLLWPPIEAAEAIEQAILSGEIPMSRLDDALERIEKMQNFKKEVLQNRQPATPDSKFADETMLEIISSGIYLLRNDINLLPIKKDVKDILIIDVTNSYDNESTDMLRKELQDYGFNVDVKSTDIYDIPSRVCWQKDIDNLYDSYDLIIFNVNMGYASTWDEGYMLIWASHLFGKDKKLIVNYGSPYFEEDYFPEDPTYIEMNCDPSREAVSALVKKIVGKSKFVGTSVLRKHTGNA